MTTARAIGTQQLPDGCIPWSVGHHADPWDMIEAAMGLDAAGLHREARRAYGWLADRQRPDGSWAAAYCDGEIIDPTIDANFVAYAAAGTWHHFLSTGDDRWLARMWPTIERSIDLVLDLQDTSGAILWARDADYRPWPGALLTSSSCIYLSLRAAITIAERTGNERPDWELSLASLGRAIATPKDNFEPKDRYAMDWYYPALGGAVEGDDARHMLARRWDAFVIDERGCRCVDDRPWVTTGETCELVLTCDLLGLQTEAEQLFGWIHHLRDDDGLYWTGANYPGGERWPDEKTTWSAGSVLLAAAALEGDEATLGLFRGTALAPRPSTALDPLSDPASQL
ncbi:MAG: prenyltransferase [Actinomycetota bacterium]